MQNNIKILVLIILLFVMSFKSKLYSQTDESQRAMWMFNIAYGVTWPNEDAIKVFKIGVFSSNKEFQEIKKLVDSGLKIKGKEVELIKFRRKEEIRPTEILYVTRNERDNLPLIFQEIKTKPVLLFADRSRYSQITVINFLPIGKGKKRYEVNTVNAKKMNLKLSKTLMKYGGSEDDLRDMYSETEKKLKAERKLLDEKILLIKDQKVLLNEKENLIARKEKEIKKQIEENKTKAEQLEIKEQEILSRNMKIDTMSKKAYEQEQEKIKNLEILEQLDKNIKEQKENYEKKKSEIDSIDKELKNKSKELGKAEQTVIEHKGTIDSQREVILMFIGFLIIIIFLIFLILRGYFKKQKINKQLQSQNIAINQQKEEIIMQSKQLELINTELEKLSIVADKTDNAVTIMDAEGNFLWVNAGFTRLYKYTLQSFKNEKGTNIIKSSTNKNIEEIISKCINGKETVIYEKLTKAKNGIELWVQTTITPILDEQGNVTKLIAIDTDINKLKNAENEIRSQHKMIIGQARELEKQNKELEKLSIVASETANAILITDEKGDFIWINDAFTRMFGYTFDDLVTNISKNIISKKTAPEIKMTIEDCIKNKKTVDYEFKIKTKSGNYLWIHTTLTPILKNNKVEKLIAIDTDITKLKKAEFEIIQKSEELMSQGEELKYQNQKIELQNKHIRSSIIYAHNIQKAILPVKSEMDKFVKSFVVFRPKDIVSGDFYWFAELPARDGFSEKIFVAAVDCTGHGVPGAFMSLIANRLLNEIVLESKIINSHDILETLDVRVKKALRQEKTDNNDGMDLCLCVLEKKDKNTYLLKYSGAKRPLFYFQKNSKKIEILKADRRSIGGIGKKRKRVNFTQQEIEIKSGGLIWLSTDGMIDQNNKARKRYGTPAFINLLERIKTKPLENQQQIIENELEQYQGNEEQRDDITVLGIKV